MTKRSWSKPSWKHIYVQVPVYDLVFRSSNKKTHCSIISCILKTKKVLTYNAWCPQLPTLCIYPLFSGPFHGISWFLQHMVSPRTNGAAMIKCMSIQGLVIINTSQLPPLSVQLDLLSTSKPTLPYNKKLIRVSSVPRYHSVMIPSLFVI